MVLKLATDIQNILEKPFLTLDFQIIVNGLRETLDFLVIFGRLIEILIGYLYLVSALISLYNSSWYL